MRGLTFTPSGENILSLGDDKTIKLWSMNEDQEDPINTILSKVIKIMHYFRKLNGFSLILFACFQTIVTSLSHQRGENRFVTCGEVCQLWEHGRNEPIRSYQWGVDSLHHVSFNQIETNLLGKNFLNTTLLSLLYVVKTFLLEHVFYFCFDFPCEAACASDRSIILYDTRDSGPIRKVVMKLRSNSLCWNPMEAFVFTVANEDYK